MVALGTEAPAFELLDVISGKAMSRDDVFALVEREGGERARHGLLVMFLCVHCPYVKHLEQGIATLAKDYEGRIAFCAIQSNDIVQYPQDGPEGMREQASRLGWDFPYLLDEQQEVARSYGAECTPDFFLFDGEKKLVYRGQMDASRPRRSDGWGNDIAVSGEDLRAAMEALLSGAAPLEEQRASIGCNIKWVTT